MNEITLEKVDQIRERTGVSYAIAKEALVQANGDVLEALILIENSEFIAENPSIVKEEKKDVKTVEEFKAWIKGIIEKGNVSRIKIKKEDEVLVDVPVNAGIAATVIGIVLPPVLAFGVIAAVATKITIEITKTDGSVEVVNQYIKKAYDDTKGKVSGLSGKIKEKISEVKEIKKPKVKIKKDKEDDEEKVFTYTVKFDD